MAMNYRSILSNFSVALVAQGLSTMVGLLTSIVVPKLLGVEEFGYWQLFIFYASYVPLFSLGLNDGIYLVEGGHDRDATDKAALKSQFLVECGYQLVFGAIIVAVSLSGTLGSERSFVLFMTAVYLVLVNATNFFGYLFQAMNESKLYSALTMVNSVMFLVPLGIMLLFQDTDFKHYVIFYTLARVASLGFALWKARDFVTAGLVELRTALSLCWSNIRVGAKVLLSTTAGTLILGVARFMVDANWGIAEFGIVSLAVLITTFVMTLASQVTMVLFPALRQAEREEAISFFVAARDGLSTLLPLAYVLYAPLAVLLTWWLPQYEASFRLFALLMPLCVFDTQMTAVGNTFLWVLRKEGRLLAVNLCTLSISALFAAVGTFVLHSIPFVFGGAVLAVIVRYIYTERYVSRSFGVDGTLLHLGAIALSACFVASAFLLPTWEAWGLITVSCALYVFVNRGLLAKVVRSLKSSRRA